MRSINKIIIHCSATPDGRVVSAAEIDKWHRQRGFAMIGYHYVIGLDGSVEKGRDETQVGAHCEGQNSISIGICYIGGLDHNGKPMDTRTTKQISAMHLLIRELKKKYPQATIHGHNEFARKACPCFNVKNEFK
ncbi:N-acetylmuramoyl-L-alanine amidase [Breznakibacter xylanolyticus]|uniref:N-acetylmuramoyl-L-alanine amidase n=1 Tax=Breznakibacter xylanolyticus TaxID=990 RepID=A0A2W7NDU8_9BACT|nr:N-acetylmuramoyl-L-alanine amidase [Breznakibacter xylanolyticus]PZX18110.1 N-acetylmuramoyl-L-alanine amidase [Breznakibacter xylanolyticus]